MSFIIKRPGVGVIARTYDTRTTAVLVRALMDDSSINSRLVIHTSGSAANNPPGQADVLHAHKGMSTDDIQTKVAGLRHN